MATAQSPTRPITLVLLGEFGSGKSASGNTILGEDKFTSDATAELLTTQCQRAEKDLYGRWVTVIDTPDFFDEDLEEPERQVSECREMCEGRECVYLLVIQIGRFTEGEKSILRKLEKKLGKIRDRTIILFTRGDDLKGRSIDDYVKNTNTHLQKLIVECGNRYNVFNNEDRDKRREQVEELMGQICRVNAGGKRGVKREGSEGTIPDRPPRQTQPASCPSGVWSRPCWEWVEGVQHSDGLVDEVQISTCPITLVLLGKFGSGKSASGNTILGEDKFASEATAEPLTTQCEKAGRYVCGTLVTVIDTPDFLHEDLQNRDKHVRESRECDGRECVYLLVIQIGPFNAGEKDILKKLENKLGTIRDRTIILFTRGDDLKGRSIVDYVRNTNRHLKSLVEECSDRYHVFNNRIQDKEQVKQLMEKIIRVLQQPKGSQG